MTNYLSQIDTKRFGFNIAKINNIKIIQKDGFIQTLKLQGVKLIISRVSSENISAINNLENIGFRIKDIQSTYKFDLDRYDINTSSLNPEISIREASKDDILELSSISKISFDGYGHYFADDRLDKNQCREIYNDWIQKSVLDNNIADKVFIAIINEEIAGFLSFKIYEENKKKYGTGGIGAVSEKFRSKNVFSTLTLKGLLWGKTIGLKWEEHNVLNTNYPVNRVFSKLGFSIERSYITFHYWLD